MDCVMIEFLKEHMGIISALVVCMIFLSKIESHDLMHLGGIIVAFLVVFYFKK